MNKTVYDVILAETKGHYTAVKSALSALESFENIPGVTSAQIVTNMKEYLAELASSYEKDYIHDEAMTKIYKNI